MNRDELKQKLAQLGAAGHSDGMRRGALEAHAAAAGRLCADDGSGCCASCGVSLATCQACGGTGYHVAGCELFDGEDGEDGAAGPGPHRVRAWEGGAL